MAGISKKKIKTKGGKEVIRYVITYRDVFGKQHTSGCYETIKKAKKDLNKFDNVNPETKNITYGMIFQEFLSRAETNYSESTHKDYKRYYEQYFKIVDDIQYGKIDSLTWQKRFDDILKNSSPYVAKACLKMAKAAANYSKKHRRIEYNVFDNIEKIELPKADINHLTISEIKAILNKCKSHYSEYYALLYTFVSTGAREGEIFALTKEDFSYKDKTLKISKQYTKGKLLPHPKTSHSNRLIYFSDDLAEILNKHIKTLNPDNSLLFPNKIGKYMHASNFLRRVFKPLLKDCEITKRVRIHDLRGSYIDMTQAQGIPIKFTQNNVGHARSSTTLDIYNQNSADMINFAQNALNSVFEKCEKNVSINKIVPNDKVILFRKKRSITGQ